MESRKLISMVDYVISKWKIDLTIHDRKSIKNYAAFLSMPLTLGMFIPTDEEGNVINPPIERLQYGGGYKIRESENTEYQKALSNVIFEGFTAKKVKEYYLIQKEGLDVWVSWNESRNIEWLLNYTDLILTQSAITKYKI